MPALQAYALRHSVVVSFISKFPIIRNENRVHNARRYNNINRCTCIYIYFAATSENIYFRFSLRWQVVRAKVI